MMPEVKLLVTAFGLIVLGQTAPASIDYGGWVKAAAEISATGALIAAFGYVLRVEIPAMREQYEKQQTEFIAALARITDRHENRQTAFTATLDRITDRWDGWAKITHDDHEAAMKESRERTQACTETRIAMQMENDANAVRAHEDAERAHVDLDAKHEDAERAHVDLDAKHEDAERAHVDASKAKEAGG